MKTTTTTNLLDAVRSETKLLVLTHLKCQLNGETPPDLTEALTVRLYDVFAQRLASPIRQAVDAALTQAITRAVNDSLLGTLDQVLEDAVDAAIGSAVADLAEAHRNSGAYTGKTIFGVPPLPQTTEDSPVTVPMTADTTAMAEPAVLTMAAAAQVTAAPVEETTATEEPATIEVSATAPESATAQTEEPAAANATTPALPPPTQEPGEQRELFPDPTEQVETTATAPQTTANGPTEEHDPETTTEASPEPTSEPQPLPAEPLPAEAPAEKPADQVETSEASSDTAPVVADGGEIGPEAAEAIRRLHGEGRTVRSISRTLKIRELLVRFVINADPTAR